MVKAAILRTSSTSGAGSGTGLWQANSRAVPKLMYAILFHIIHLVGRDYITVKLIKPKYTTLYAHHVDVLPGT